MKKQKTFLCQALDKDRRRNNILSPRIQMGIFHQFFIEMLWMKRFYKKNVSCVELNDNTFDLRKYINALCDQGKLRAAVISTFRVNLNYISSNAFRLAKSSIPTFILHGDAASQRRLEPTPTTSPRAEGTPPRKRHKKEQESSSDVEDDISINMPKNFHVHQVPAPVEHITVNLRFFSRTRMFTWLLPLRTWYGQ